MLTNKQIGEIRDHLERAQNPVFYYDNDADGFCSYVILRRFLGRGKGVAVRSFPGLDASYARKAKELNADYVFVLDKPVISKEFVETVDSLGLPLVWIDHHDVPLEDFGSVKNFYTYNPAKNKEKSAEPVTYLCYRLTDRKEDLWLAVIGCISDHFLPEFSKEFERQYPEFWGKVEKPFDAYFGTEIGKIAQALNFGLKDSVTHVVQLQNFFISCRNPGDVFMEVYANYSFRKKFLEIKKKYDSLLSKATRSVGDDMIFFDYSGDLSISSEISNELSYIYPGKYVVVAYRKGAISNLSLRGKDVKKILERILKNISGTGGGHDDAVGARIETADLTKFKELMEEEIERSKGNA